MFFVKNKVKIQVRFKLNSILRKTKVEKNLQKSQNGKKSVAEKKGRKNSKKRRIEASCSNPNSSGTRSTSDTDSGSTTD